MSSPPPTSSNGGGGSNGGEGHLPPRTRRVRSFLRPLLDQKHHHAKAKWLNLDALVLTWNVHAKLPKDPNDINEVLETKDGKQVDMYVIALQEVVDLNPFNVAIRPHHAAIPWENIIEAAIEREQRYAKVCVKQLVGILLLVYVRHSLFPFISEIQTDSLGLGVVRLGNKGAVMFRMKLFGSDIVILNTHLAPHQRNVVKRDKNYLDIVSNVCYIDNDFNVRSIFDADLLIWAGDLNYRLDYPIEDVQKVVSMIEGSMMEGSREFSSLCAHDQLTVSRNTTRAFDDLCEGKIDFAPTYKLKPLASQEYDTSRMPGWTDRILYRVNNRINTTLKSVRLLGYGSIQQCQHSDHRPVRALFKMSIQDPHSLKNDSSSGALMVWSILEVAQFFVMVILVPFHFDESLYSNLKQGYLLGWSIGGIRLEMVDGNHHRPSSNTLNELTGVERLSWELDVDPNSIGLTVLLNFLFAIVTITGILLLIWGLCCMLSMQYNYFRTKQASEYPFWAIYQTLTIVLIVGVFPCFSLGTFHISLCYGESSQYYTNSTLSSPGCASLTTMVILMFGSYVYMVYYLSQKVIDEEAFILIFTDQRSKAIWGHFWRLYRFEGRYFAIGDVAMRMVGGIIVGSKPEAITALVLLLVTQFILATLLFYLRPYRHLRTGILMKTIYTLRACLCLLLLALEAANKDVLQEAIAYLLTVSYIAAISLYTLFFAYHQGRKLLQQVVSRCLPCVRGACPFLLRTATHHHRGYHHRDDDDVSEEDHTRYDVLDHNANIFNMDQKSAGKHGMCKGGYRNLDE